MKNENLSACSPVPLRHVVVAPAQRENQSYGARRTENYELEYVAKGRGNVLVDGDELPATDHALLFRRPGMLVEGRGVYHSHYVEFACNTSGEHPKALEALPGVFFLDEWHEVEEIFMSMFKEYFRSEPDWELGFKISVLRLLRMLLQNGRYQARTAQASPEAIKIILQSTEYIRAQFTSPLTLNQLAAQAGYSVYHYSHLFKQITTSPPLRYLNKVRLGHAKQLLAETTLSTEEVMCRCGFNNYSYFLRSFKAHCGQTPGKYRMKQWRHHNETHH